VGHPKLVELLHDDFFDYAKIEDRLKGYNACYFCLGVSSVGMSEQNYRRVIYDLTMEAAKTLSRANSDMTFCYVSGAGTDSTEKGSVMWARVKEKTENDLMKLPFKAVYLFRPGFIKPAKGLKHAHSISKIVGLLYPLWKDLVPKYVCSLEDVGLVMIRVTTENHPKRIIENADITQLVRPR
jgi:uncharacterized protein YbjT (DUF2867 family)